MLTFIFPIISAVLCAGIEYLRIKLAHGKVYNINKLWTINIGVVFFVISLASSVSYYDDIMPDDVLFYILYYVGCRGLIYDVVLNLLRGLKYNYISHTTNSLIDRIFTNKYSFIVIKFAYLLIMIIFGVLWQLR
jgi:hypothetical protein